MSKFLKIDDWETVDAASTGTSLALGVGDPLTMVGFSLFMEGQAGTQAEKPEAKSKDPEAGAEGEKQSAGPLKKSAAARRNIMDAPKPPSWWPE